MAKKIGVTFSIDEDIFLNFTLAVILNNDSREDLLENFMRSYVEKKSRKPQPSPPLNDYKSQPSLPNDYTEQLLQKCRSKKISWLVQNVLQKLLESGVATDLEVAEFQKAHKQVYAEKYHVPCGDHVKEIFNLSLPLIITAERKLKYDDSPKKFYKDSFSIGGEKYHLCLQWFTEQRDGVEAWIRKKLPIWFAQSDARSRDEMLRRPDTPS
ncbi:MAG: hypothetical protein SR1Q7_05075 [Quinella sp. 1Q7]|nr:hypothetical protein [Quinella sp. 1Q7]